MNRLEREQLIIDLLSQRGPMAGRDLRRELNGIILERNVQIADSTAFYRAATRARLRWLFVPAYRQISGPAFYAHMAELEDQAVVESWDQPEVIDGHVLNIRWYTIAEGSQGTRKRVEGLLPDELGPGLSLA